jgi:dihydropyrimidinase
VSAASRFDLIVRNGTLVIPGVGTVAADIGISGNRIAAIGDELAGPAGDVLDASGKVVLPGIFDPHVHIGNELSFEQEAQTETRAAILGGVTTIGIMLRSLEDSYFLHLPAFRRAMDEMSYVDSVFHLQIFTEQQIAEMPDYARQYGVRSFKFYMSGIPGIVNSVTDDVLFAGFRQAASVGTDVVVCVHRETGALIEDCGRSLPDALSGDAGEFSQLFSSIVFRVAYNLSNSNALISQDETGPEAMRRVKLHFCCAPLGPRARRSPLDLERRRCAKSKKQGVAAA